MTENRTRRQDSRHSIEPLDLTGLLLDFLSSWKWFLLCVIVCVSLAYVKYKREIPVYSVAASVYLADDNNSQEQSAVLGVDKRNMFTDLGVDETEVRRLMSRGTIEPIVRELGLSYRYFMKGFWRDEPIYRNKPVVAQMDSLALNRLANSINISVTPEGNDRYQIITETGFGGEKQKKETVTTLPATIATANGDVRLSLSETSSGFTSGTEKISIVNPSVVAGQLSLYTFNVGYAQNSDKILRMLLHTDNVESGIDFMKALINQYNEDMINDKNRSAVQTEEFILDRLMMINGELRDVEQRLEQYKRDHGIPVSVEAQASIYSEKRTRAEEELFDLNVQSELLGQIESGIARKDDYSAIAGIAEDETLNNEIADYNRKIGNLNRTLETASHDNPLVKKMKEDLDRDKDKLLSTVRASRSNLNMRRSSVRSKGNESAGRLTSVPTIDKGLQEIFREQQVKVNIYTYLLQKREEIALQKTLATPTARFIDNPEATGLVQPFLRNYLLFGLVAGLLIPALIILIRHLLFPTFKDKAELKRATDIPILGEVCFVKGANGLVSGNKENQVNELLRLIRNNIEFTNPGKEKKLILVTSTISGEGKSFFASNLASTFAMANKKVLLIGCDIRRPRLHRFFSFHNDKGLTTYLAGMTDNISEIIRSIDGHPNMSVLPAGPIAPNPNELLMTDRFKELLDYARKNYDYVIIDSAPIGMVSDTLLVAPLTDIQLFVVRSGMTRRRSLEIVESEITSGRLKNCYLILNGVQMNSGSYAYRRYGNYSHKNHYGYN